MWVIVGVAGARCRATARWLVAGAWRWKRYTLGLDEPGVGSEVEEVVGKSTPERDAFHLGCCSYADLKESPVGFEVGVDGFTGGGSLLVNLLTVIAGQHPCALQHVEHVVVKDVPVVAIFGRMFAFAKRAIESPPS